MHTYHCCVSFHSVFQNIPSERIRKILGDVDSLTEEKIDEILNEFLRDFKDGSFVSKGWPPHFSAYIVSKAALNALTRILAKKYPSIMINAICPGFVKTDINANTGVLSVEEGGASPTRLALMPPGALSGLFYVRYEVSSFDESGDIQEKAPWLIKAGNDVAPPTICQKAALNAYTRAMAKKHPSTCVNCVRSGFCKTDKLWHEGAASPVKLALMPNGDPCGLFFMRQEASSFECTMKVNNAGISGFLTDFDTLRSAMERGKTKGILSDADNLNEEKIDKVLNEFLKDTKEGSLAHEGWPQVLKVLSGLLCCKMVHPLAFSSFVKKYRLLNEDQIG
ncbi:hypothetical protein Cgig2_033390 [Carnegiea gigantea]|uniref:(+)-neomenthol dehydrogenase-like n=1 Tax=Carnegiea gigantea TaxID=171969 RepID=A0A9Q1QQP9_9CARY|nr:hypothetical protein Cgig2_033390 [Carnegiea gigantea]